MKETSGQRTLDAMIIASELYIQQLLDEYNRYMLGDRADMTLPEQEVTNAEENIYGQSQ